MNTIAYCHPFVAPEWIAAHGLAPRWVRPRAPEQCTWFGAGRAVCPYAGALTDAALSGREPQPLVMTTTCDQSRYAAALIEHQGGPPVFLMNVPSTWQNAAAGKLYLDELRRLGRFLVRHGGRSPSDEFLATTMARYQRARAAMHEARASLSGWQFAAALAEVRSASRLPRLTASEASRNDGRPSVPLAMVGGPLLEKHLAIFDWVEQAGARVVLDATESGERTLPALFDEERTRQDPLAELARAYFDSIPDVFRRPNHELYRWLGRELVARGARGILFHRYVWCDLWHAELARLKSWSPVPVVEIDACDDGDSRDRASGRIEALLEMLQ
jgi:benzoyl-CoA reductase/2-hydroxyglutaryl-CoA dehydratase subunit BcrC/BadD/HgdB